jgi:ketosteroid isomerase-like protein
VAVVSNKAILEDLAQRFFEAWNSQDVNRVVACYTDDTTYIDPNTRGPVSGKLALHAYLTKLFDRWDMYWEGRELFPLNDNAGSAALWTATLRPKNSERGWDG